MFVQSADKLAEMRTKFHIIQAKLIMSVWCFTVQCSLLLDTNINIRFIYVRSSLQENIQRVLKRNSFTFSFLALGLFISIFNVAGKLHLKRFCRTNDNQFFQCSFTSRESKQELTVWDLSSTEPAWILSLAGAPPSSR